MMLASNSMALADWRRKVAEMYVAVRQHDNPEQAWYDFRTARNALFKTHAQSPLTTEQKADFVSLSYFSYDPAWCLAGTVDHSVDRETFTATLAAEGEFRYTRVARVSFIVRGKQAVLSLFWIEGYGGGLFLPFRDASNGDTTYSGGRYLYDTIKGADLSTNADEFMLDFNYAYNPSCAYNEQWVCPLPPAENRLPFAVHAGEQRWNVEDRQVVRPHRE
jgi:uncharacterized protein (DUF1684 family)